MSTEILISSDPWENRVAILEDGSLSEIYFEREERVIGSIYKGKVQNVLPGMGASFVDIGLGRNAFLYVDDINKTPLNIGDVEITQGRSGWTINEKVNRGDDVLVQIVKEPRGLKGARISTNISLPGRFLILMPTGRYSGVSRKIESADERNRLKAVMKMIRPEGMATVVRTAAAGVSQAELIADLGVLIRMWHGILETFKRAPSPSLLHKDMNLVYKAARDFITPDVKSVLIDSHDEYEKVRDFLRLLGPQYLDRLQHYNSGRDLFKDYKVDEELQRLMRPKVNLPAGGSIVIESTEALTVIDVNSGKFTGGKNLEDTIVKTNMEAAAEIARQVRLRDIGGIIVCDFIDMNHESSRTKVLQILEAGLRKDRTRTTIQSFSALGLLEFTRKRVGKDLASQLRGACPVCRGLGSVMSPESVAIQALRQVRTTAHEGTPVMVEVAPTVGAQLEYWYEDEKLALEAQIKAPIAIRADARIHPEHTHVSVLEAEVDAKRKRKKGAIEAPVMKPPFKAGDEIEVELLTLALPNPQSALAVVDGFLVEVENAAAAAGGRITIRISEITEEGIVAESTAPIAVAVQAGEGKKRRRRGGKGRKRALTPAEQAEELRELAEEAAKGVGARPALGISTQSEAEEEDAMVHNAQTPEGSKTVSIAPPAPADIPRSMPERSGEHPRGDAAMSAEEERKRRRRRRRGRGRGPGDEAGAGIPPASLEQQVRAPMPAPAPKAPPLPFIAKGQPPAAGHFTSVLPGESLSGRAINGGTSTPAPAPVAPPPAAQAQAPQPPPPAQSGAPQSPEEGEHRRRRRRRRRRGRGGAGDAAFVPGQSERPAVPDRHIFRVGSNGAAESTGDTAPREPGRAIAAVERRPMQVAIEAPPPSLRVAEIPPKGVRPTRRRAGTAPAKRAEALQASPLQALPSPAPDPTPAPKRGGTRKVAPIAAAVPKRTRKKREDAAEAVAAKPKRASKAAASAEKPARKTSARKTPASRKKTKA